MTTPYLEICTADGALSAVLMNGDTNTSYMLESGAWALSLSALNDSTFATADKYYAPVDEELNITIRGSSAQECYSYLNTLNRLMEQALQYERCASVSPVLLKFAPQGSSTASAASPYVCRVLGRTDSDRISPLQTSNDWGDIYRNILPVRLRFARTGAWLLGTDTATTTTPYCVPSAANFTASTFLLSPTAITTTIQNSLAGYVIIAPNGYIKSIDATSFTGGTGVVSSVADATAVGGSVARWTLPATGAFAVNNTAADFSGFTTETDLIDIYATVKSSSANTLVSVKLVTNNDNYVETLVMPLNSTDYQALFLGTVALPRTQAARSYTRMFVNATGTAGQYIDVDNIYLVGRSASTCTMMVDARAHAFNSLLAYTFDPNPNGRPIEEDSHGVVVTRYGQMAMSKEAAMSVVYIMTGSFAVSGLNAWRPSTSSYDWTLTRTTSYLMPV